MMMDHSPDTDDDDTAQDPDKLALIRAVATVLVNAAHDYAEAAGAPLHHPTWDQLSRLEQNLAMAGVISLVKHHGSLVDELRGVFHD